MKEILSHITAVVNVWYAEMKTIAKDEGVLLFFVFLPLVYPLLYSWIYNNEVVREVPTAVVDNSGTALSREFIKKFDAAPDVCVAYRCNSLEDAKRIIGKGEAYGIIYIPHDFDKNIGRGEQSHVSVFCDMSYLLTYKAIYSTAVAISMEMGTEIQKRLIDNKTVRDAEITTHPLLSEDVPIFNAPGGYGNFILPGVLVLIIQQAILLGVGMIVGTERERQFANYRASKGGSTVGRAFTLLCGKSVAYLMIFSVMLAWITLAVPYFFGFTSIAHGGDLLQFFTPYLLSCIFFALTFSALVRYRESVILIVVFSSVPLLFLSGVSWPQSNIPGAWQGIAVLFPSSFCIRGFIRMGSMGALLPDVAREYHALWIQTFCYAATALFVIWRRVRTAKDTGITSTLAQKSKETSHEGTILS